MAAINFPSSPTLNQEFLAGNNVTYKWNGVAWVVKAGNKYVQSPVRQTVLAGPVDNKGRADFLEEKPGNLPGTFTVRTKGVDSQTPLILSYGDGFSSIGPKDVIMPITQDLEWELDNNMDNYLYIDLDDSNQGLPLTFGNVTPGKTRIPPTYYINDNARQGIKRLDPVRTSNVLPYGTMLWSSLLSTNYAWHTSKSVVDTTQWVPAATSFNTTTGEPNGEVFLGVDFDKYKIKALEYEIGSAFSAPTAPHTVDSVAPTAWKLQGSNDGTDWTDLDERVNENTGWVLQQTKRFTVQTPGFYRMYRILILAMGSSFTLGYCNVGRFRLHGKPLFKLNPVLTDYAAPWGSVIFTSEYSATYKAWYIGTGITDANGWLSAAGTFNKDTGEAIFPTAVGYDLGPNNKMKAIKYNVMGGYNSTAATALSYPMWWKLEGSDNQIDWTVLDERNSITDWTYQNAKEFNVTTPGFYRYYRLNILQKSIGPTHYDYVAVAQFDLFGDMNNSFFYPVDHRSRGIVCAEDGSYEPRLRIYVGKVTVANGIITDIRSFAYQGLYVSDYFSQAVSQTTALAHNIGTAKIDLTTLADLNTSVARVPVAGAAVNANALVSNTSATSGAGFMIRADDDCRMSYVTYTLCNPTDIAIMAKRAF